MTQKINGATHHFSLQGWLTRGSLQDALKAIEAEVALHPTKAETRWVLFQTLCLTGEWQRALKQLQVYHKLVPDADKLVHSMRDLIRSEHHREAVFQGKQDPGFMVNEVPEWMLRLLEALRANSAGQTAQADDLREAAFALAPNIEGERSGQNFSWMTESDSRMGPILELVLAGMYRWCPLQDIQKINVKPPTSLLDLLWLPADLILKDGTTCKVFIPVRYPNTVQTNSDALRLARTTEWREVGQTAVCGLGQKVWSTEQGDIALFELGEVTFK